MKEGGVIFIFKMQKDFVIGTSIFIVFVTAFGLSPTLSAATFSLLFLLQTISPCTIDGHRRNDLAYGPHAESEHVLMQYLCKPFALVMTLRDGIYGTAKSSSLQGK